MNRITKLMIGGGMMAATLSVGAVAIAQDAPPPRPGHGMMKMPETRAEVQTMVAAHFKMIDANKDGFVTRDEMAAGREKMRTEMKAKFEARRAERRADMFAKLDANKDGNISKAEFTTPPAKPEGRDGMRGPGGHGPDGKMHGGRFGRGGHGGGMFGERWFAKADANKDNKVSLAEAQAAPLARFDQADTNKDGKLSDAEKQAARQAMRGGWKGRGER
ncbi:calcium-binding protein [Sphingomonas montanisoli]|nr:calcium-binding protein [Sphingomonas montanisoli]